MRWFRETLRRRRIFLLGFLLVETFFLVDGQQFVYAYQVAEQQEPQEPAEGVLSSAVRESFEERWKKRQLEPIPSAGHEWAGPAPRAPGPKVLPIRRAEKKAKSLEGTASVSVKSPEVKPVSAPRPTISKAGVAPEIVALAESLGKSPALIFGFVHDNIDYDPKWGAVKSPLGTLQEKSGTSWDQAWLLVNLLTAVGVDARFEWGEVELTPKMLTNITGVDDPLRAGDLLTTAGVPVVLIVEGSRVVAARMSHVWVKAHLDYLPRRGERLGPPDTWVRMDPSLKRFEVAGGVRLDEAVPFDLGEYLQSGTPFSPRQTYEETLQGHIAENNVGVGGIEELKRSKTLRQERFPYVPGSLRAKILSVGGEATEIPPAFQQQLELEVRKAGGPVLLTWSTPWPAVYGQRLELAWPGATSADQATLDLNGGVFATPPFEVKLRPSLRLDGTEVIGGEAIGSAEDVEVLATFTPPGGSVSVAQFDVFAGEHAVFAADFGRIPQELIDRYTLKRSAATDPAEEEAWTLALAGALYLRGLAEDLEHLSQLRWRRLVKLGNVILAAQRGAVSRAPDGTPLTLGPAPKSIDLGSMVLGLFPPDGAAPSAASAVRTLELLGAHGAFLEGIIWNEVIGGEQVSAVSFLTRAVREGQTLTRVDATNLDSALAAAELSTTAETSIRAGVGQGLVAWISESQLPVDTWDATGYVLEDPTTGGAGYFVTFERLVPSLDATIVFNTPQDLDKVTAPINVVATLEGTDVESWSLSYRAADGGQPVEMASGTGTFTDVTLAQFDPTLLFNGIYNLVLTARDAAGLHFSKNISVIVEGNMKIGNFTLSFVDLSIPVSGLAINVIRIYDSRDKQKHDFGVGWKLDIQQGSYRNNRLPGDGWRFHAGLLPCQVTQETKSHLTAIRLSDREMYKFKLNLSGGAAVLGGCLADAGFEFIEGSFAGATLDLIGNNQVFYENGSDRVIDTESFGIFTPNKVLLTTRDLRRFELDLTLGITKVADGNSNFLEITPNGILHSSGKGVSFQRDEEGRIAAIEDAEGGRMIYEYDDAGNLASFTDQEGYVDRFTYDDLHFMKEIENPRGNAAHNDYDEEGRLIRSTDPLGNTIELTHELGERRERVRDRRGFTRVFEYDQRGNVVRETNAKGKVTLRSYDDHDRLLSETDPLGNTTNYTYDDNFNLIAITDPLGTSRKWTYNSLGKPLTIADPNGNKATFTYDTTGNPIGCGSFRTGRV